MPFPESERRIFHVLICRNCNARNPWRATMCRKCQGKSLRKKRAVQKKA